MAWEGRDEKDQPEAIHEDLGRGGTGGASGLEPGVAAGGAEEAGVTCGAGKACRNAAAGRAAQARAKAEAQQGAGRGGEESCRAARPPAHRYARSCVALRRGACVCLPGATASAQRAENLRCHSEGVRRRRTTEESLRRDASLRSA